MQNSNIMARQTAKSQRENAPKKIFYPSETLKKIPFTIFVTETEYQLLPHEKETEILRRMGRCHARHL